MATSDNDHIVGPTDKKSSQQVNQSIPSNIPYRVESATEAKTRNPPIVRDRRLIPHRKIAPERARKAIMAQSSMAGTSSSA